MVIMIFISLNVLFLQADQQLEAERNLAPVKKVHLDCCQPEYLIVLVWSLRQCNRFQLICL